MTLAQPQHPQHPQRPASEPLDLSEKGGPKDGQPQKLDRRLFVQLTVFTGCAHPEILGPELQAAGVDCVVYAEAGDPRGVGVLALAEDPETLVRKLRPAMSKGAFAALTVKPEFSMFGRTYALGYEPNLEDWLIERPKRVVKDPAASWAIWYPLRRSGAFAQLSRQEQGQILKEHGQIGRQFGDAGFASDIRLACHGLDKNDNDFVIGLIGAKLHPLSACVETMRGTQQTSKYLTNLGPFFVGQAVWRSK
jgi:chlorite dismutase